MKNKFIRVSCSVFDRIKKNYWTFLLSAILLLICFNNALLAGANADFFPVNGDFQNYNVVRRFLDGQVPFMDFACYLGCGHLYLGSALTFLVGGLDTDLMDSKFAFRFLSTFSFILISVVIIKSIIQNKLSLTLFMTLWIVLLSIPFMYLDRDVPICEFFLYSNSARGIRGMAPAIFIILIVLLTKIDYIFKVKFPSPIVFGVPTGIIVFYSNCYGMGSAFCAIIIYIISIIFSDRSLKGKTNCIFSYILVTAITFLIVGLIVTKGNINYYIHSLIGTGGMQAWYYIANKTYYIYAIDIYSLPQGIIAFLYLILYTKNIGNERKRVRFGIPLFMNAVAFVTANEYKLLSGGYIHEVSSVILFFTIFAEICRYLLDVHKNFITIHYVTFRKYGLYFTILTFLGFTLAACGIIYKKTACLTDVKHVGKMTELGTSILSTDEFMRKDDVVFSTYASGLEAYRGQFQPTGYDYIIHVLGNDAIKQYMSDFNEGKFDYVATQRETYTFWEYWIINENWYFYRELFRNYEPVYANKYELFWRKRRKELNNACNAKLKIDKLSDNKIKLFIEAKDIKYGRADVELSYQVKKDKSFRSLLTLNSMMHVDNSNHLKISQVKENEWVDSFYYLDKKANGNHISVAIIDGYGEITLTSQPEKNTYIDEFDAKLIGVFSDDCTNYAIVLNAKCFSNNIELEIANTSKNQKLINGASSIKINDLVCESSFTLAKDDSSILVKIKDYSSKMKDALIEHTYYPVIFIK